MSSRIFFKDRTVVITGASGGIGKAIALQLASYGARTFLLSRNVTVLQQIKEEIESLNGISEIIQCDVSNIDEVRRAGEKIREISGGADILITCAGKYVQDNSSLLDMEAFHDSISVNFFGTLNIIHSLLPQMKERRKGHITIINSLDSGKGIVGDGPYVAAKSALDGFGDVLRQEMKQFGIRVTSVYPGRVDTPMIESIKVPSISAKIKPDKVAKAVLKGIRKNRALVIVPATLSFIPVLNKIAPVMMDKLYRLFRLEGEVIK